jgi:hypothetical protein
VSALRPPSETVESLRTTLQKLEQENPPDDESLTELKRILLARIAELELVQALEAAATPSDEAPKPADLVPPPSAAEENNSSQPTSATNLEKLD